MLSPIMFAAAVLGGVPDIPPPATESASVEQTSPQPVPEAGEGGPYEPVEEQTVAVEAPAGEAPALFSIAPDPVLDRRYAPREREPLNRVATPF